MTVIPVTKRFMYARDQCHISGNNVMQFEVNVRVLELKREIHRADRLAICHLNKSFDHNELLFLISFKVLTCVRISVRCLFK